MKTRALLLYRRRWGMLYLPVLLLASLLTVVAARYWFPLPPTTLALSAPKPGAGFAPLAERYRKELAHRGITLELSNSETLAHLLIGQLTDALNPVGATFAAGLLSNSVPLKTTRTQYTSVQALAILGKHPVWVFTNDERINSMSQLRGKRIAAGPVSSMTREAAQLLLLQAQISDNQVVWEQELAAMPAGDALFRGQIDAVFVIADSEAPVIRMLSRTDNIYMVGVARANALTALEPRLWATVLPQGAIELRGNVPPKDLTLLYTNNHLVIRSDMHPALQRVLLDVATEIHAVPTLLQQQDEYPDFLGTDFALSPHALRYSKGYRPWLEQIFPYWWAQLAHLVLYGVLPILVLTALALVWIPSLFSLRVSAVLSHYYGELKFLEHDMDSVIADKPMAMKSMLAKLDNMERDVTSLDLPDRYADRWYTLRAHLSAAQERLLKLRAR